MVESGRIELHPSRADPLQGLRNHLSIYRGGSPDATFTPHMERAYALSFKV